MGAIVCDTGHLGLADGIEGDRSVTPSHILMLFDAGFKLYV